MTNHGHPAIFSPGPDSGPGQVFPASSLISRPGPQFVSLFLFFSTLIIPEIADFQNLSPAPLPGCDFTLFKCDLLLKKRIGNFLFHHNLISIERSSIAKISNLIYSNFTSKALKIKSRQLRGDYAS